MAATCAQNAKDENMLQCNLILRSFIYRFTAEHSQNRGNYLCTFLIHHNSNKMCFLAELLNCTCQFLATTNWLLIMNFCWSLLIMSIIHPLTTLHWSPTSPASRRKTDTHCLWWMMLLSWQHLEWHRRQTSRHICEWSLDSESLLLCLWGRVLVGLINGGRPWQYVVPFLCLGPSPHQKLKDFWAHAFVAVFFLTPYHVSRCFKFLLPWQIVWANCKLK